VRAKLYSVMQETLIAIVPVEVRIGALRCATHVTPLSFEGKEHGHGLPSREALQSVTGILHNEHKQGNN